MRRWLGLATLLIIALGARTLAAQTCTLSVTSLSFGTYTGTLLNGTATGKVTCAGAWDIPLDAGTGVGATETIRKMTGPGGAELSYVLFTDSARTNNWGNTTGNELTGVVPQADQLGSTHRVFNEQMILACQEDMLHPSRHHNGHIE